MRLMSVPCHIDEILDALNLAWMDNLMKEHLAAWLFEMLSSEVI